MPFKLICNCDKDKLNEVIDQVKKLSNTVDELRAEINSMKFCTNLFSNYSLAKTCEKYEDEKNKIGPLHKLKKCFEKSFIPILSSNAGYRVKKKCQQMFSQSPSTFVPCPAHSSPRETPIYQHNSSSQCTKKERDSQIYESCRTSQSDKTKRTKRRSKKSASSSTKKRGKSVSRDSKKSSSLPISLTSTSSFDRSNHRDKSSKDSPCSYELDNALNSPAKRKNSGSPKNRIGKKKNRRSGTSDLISPDTTEGCRRNPVETVKRRRSVNFVGRKKYCGAIEAVESSTSSEILTSNTSVCDLQSCNVIRKEPRKDFKRKKIIKINSRERENKSRSAQCSPNCLYLKRPKLRPRDVSTNTFPDECIKVSKRAVREKRLMSQETQTSTKSDEYVDSSCFDEEIQFCSEAQRNWVDENSLISLTSQCSPRSVNIYCQRSEELYDESMSQFDKSVQEEKCEKRRKAEEPEKKKETIKKAKVASCTRTKNKKSRSDSEEFFKHRRKRTYVVSSDIGKTDEAIQHNFETRQNKFSCRGTDWRSYKEDGDISSWRKIWKKPKVTCHVQEDHVAQTPCKYCPKKYKSRYMRNTVCTNRPTNNYFTKLSRWSRKNIKRNRSNNGTMLQEQICETSSSPQELSDESCSLNSDSDVCENSQNDSIKYSRDTNRLKNEINVCSSPDKNSVKYTVCGSLSGSVRSISSESHSGEELTYNETE